MLLSDFGIEIGEMSKKELNEVIRDPEKILYQVKGDLGTYHLKNSGIYRLNKYGETDLICPTQVEIIKVNRINGKVEINICYGKSKTEIKKDLNFFLDINKVRTLSEEFRTIRGCTKYVKDYCLSKVWELIDELNGEISSSKYSYCDITTFLM